MMLTMPVTTADVAAQPTAAELRPHSMPRRHPAMATSTPKTLPLMTPCCDVTETDGGGRVCR